MTYDSFVASEIIDKKLKPQNNGEYKKECPMATATVFQDLKWYSYSKKSVYPTRLLAGELKKLEKNSENRCS